VGVGSRLGDQRPPGGPGRGGMGARYCGHLDLIREAIDGSDGQEPLKIPVRWRDCGFRHWRRVSQSRGDIAAVCEQRMPEILQLLKGRFVRVAVSGWLLETLPCGCDANRMSINDAVLSCDS